jgi:sulfotransferase
VIFDTNRTWTGRAALISQVFPPAKIICCVREVAWIIDSLESMLRKNALQTSRVFKFQPGASVYARVETLMNSDEGLIGLPWSNLREIWFSENAKRVILVNYETFTKEPARTIRRLYDALEEPHFDHDFQRVVYDEPDYDADLGMPGLHKVRERVGFVERQSCIPPDIFAKYAETNFWLKPDLNRRGATIL